MIVLEMYVDYRGWGKRTQREGRGMMWLKLQLEKMF